MEEATKDGATTTTQTTSTTTAKEKVVKIEEPLHKDLDGITPIQQVLQVINSLYRISDETDASLHTFNGEFRSVILGGMVLLFFVMQRDAKKKGVLANFLVCLFCCRLASSFIRSFTSLNEDGKNLI